MRTILHLDLDSFYVSTERLINSSLLQKPILIGGTNDRAIVIACSQETKAYGIHNGMPMKTAKELCPEAISISGNNAAYSKYSELVTEIIKEKVPVLEKSGISEFYADLSGMDKFFGTYKYAIELRQKVISETGLPISFGLSQNKTVSKVAVNVAKPNNQIKVDFGTEKSFMAPLSVKKVPMVGQKTYQMLRNLGIRYVKTIQEMPVDVMKGVLGTNGLTIWKRANGIDNTPVIAYSERKSISLEHTFNKDTIDLYKLKNLLVAMTENLSYQLRKENKLTACIVLKIKYSDFNIYTKQQKIQYTNADHILLTKVLELFNQLHQKRLLIRLVGIKFSHLIKGNLQINLFEKNTKQYQLYQALDHIRNKYGDQSIARASSLETHKLKTVSPLIPVIHKK
ncbi:DNA polymerase Y family protein [Aquimarina algicola]|uniref:DNA polymerase IV n=1 Tax=Aquimarina algicola TaxID=2589995 RepID=A0A504J4P8_9FLAO|nr:DNA polymerase IV [Aquimarina algicola]TPN82069.1 DNA polymerase IV [Aquimarina algicola]